MNSLALTSIAQLVERHPAKGHRLNSGFMVRAHAWIVGLVLVRGM